MTITEQEFRAMFPMGNHLDVYWPFIVPAMSEGLIDKPLRIAAFLAHVAVESGEFQYAEEIADGSDYEGRSDLGNTEPGDGKRYKGRGPIQITGRDAYERCGKFLGLPLVQHPEMLAEPEYGCLAAAWFWREAKPALNPASDMGWFRTTTRLVNGGLNGWLLRLDYYQRNRSILKLVPYEAIGEEMSIRAFQAYHPPLVADGIAGPRTLAVLAA